MYYLYLFLNNLKNNEKKIYKQKNEMEKVAVGQEV